MQSHTAPGFLRRMAAICYDSLLLFAVLFFATAIVLPLNAGQAFTSQQYLFPIYLLSICYLYFVWFWTKSGQTLGMKSWKIKLCLNDGRKVGWINAGIRFFAAILSLAFFGIGFLWSLIDKNQLCWHDYLSKTKLYIVRQEKPDN